LANSLVHQDFAITGTDVIIEIFADRMNKPYIICHMACSIDCKIILDNWGDELPKDKVFGTLRAVHNEENNHFRLNSRSSNFV
jgi:hypothetical protein